MAKSSNGSSSSSRKSRGSAAQGGASRSESGGSAAQHGQSGRGQSRRNGTSARAAAPGARRASTAMVKSTNPDALSATRRGYSEGQRRGRAAGGSIRSAGARVVSGAVNTVSEHPVPALMIGAGLAWLLLENRSLREVETRLVERGRELIDDVGEVVSGATETTVEALSDATTAVGRSVGTAAEYVAEGTSALGEYAANGAAAVGEYAATGASAVVGGVRDAAGYVGEGVQVGYESARETVENLWENYPLAVCAALVGAGVAAGMMLPSTRRESRMMGQTAGQLRRQLRSKGGELLERGKEIAGRAAQAVAEEGDRQGLSPQEFGRKMKRVVRSGRNAAAASE